MLVKFPISIELVKQEIGFPLVIKNRTGCNGYGIHLCHDAHNFKDIMELIHSSHSNNIMILQEFIAPSYGTDLRVFVLGE